ncbi:MAG: L,D-transpeptidase [Butyrivibrio sp.]|nr:L,D-transpeptidase [Butyrivibrio sp.]
MKKRGILYFVLFCSLAVMIMLYVMLGNYYKDSFSYGTWINHVYVTGKNVKEANKELQRQNSYNGIQVKARDGQTLYIGSDTIGMIVDYTEDLTELLNDQNPLAWGLNFIAERNREIKGSTACDKDKLREIVCNWAIFDENNEPFYTIGRGDDGFYLVTKDVYKPDKELFYEKIDEAISGKEEELDLSDDLSAYVQIEPGEADTKVKEVFEKIDLVQNKRLTLSFMEESVNFDKSDIADWILKKDELDKAQREEISDAFPGKGYFLVDGRKGHFPNRYQIIDDFVADENGNIIISCSKAYNSIIRKLGKYDTNNCISEYQKSGSGKIIVSGSKDGSLFDKSKVYDDILARLFTSSGQDADSNMEITVPVKSFSIDASELGGEYILVDMGKQHLSYYKDGELTISYDVVTGNTRLGRSTPAGFYHIYNKRYHTILRGADYASYVNYWLGVNKGIGIHDAPWRNKFGDEIYKTNGSHGCINSPYDQMEELYNLVEVGVPILLYY